MNANKFCDAGQVPIFRYFEAWTSIMIFGKSMVFHDKCLPADNSHKISCLNRYFCKKKNEKAAKFKINGHLLQIIGCAL